MITDRIDAITRIQDFRAFLPAPKSVKIELTGRCNFRCGFCALRTRVDQPKTDMDFDLFKRITVEMKEAGVEEIGLFYLGESMMAPETLVEAVKWCKEIGIPYVFLTSNASLAEPLLVYTLMADGLDSLKWSVNASDEEQFKEVMGVSQKLFWKALRNIKEAKTVRDSGRFKTTLSASSIKYDGVQQEKMEALLKEHVLPFVDQHYFLPLYSMGMYAGKVKDAIGYAPTHGNSGRIDETTGLPNRKPIPCWSLFTEGHIRADGHVSACCFGSDDRFDVGDLTTQSFMEAWNSPKFQEIRAAHIKADTCGTSSLHNTMCASCVAYGGSDEEVGNGKICGTEIREMDCFRG